MPTDRSGFKIRGEETETPDSGYDNPRSSSDKSSTSLITLRDVCDGEDTGQADIKRSGQATSSSLISSSREQGLGDTVGSRCNAFANRENEDSDSGIAESSPSLISYSHGCGLRITEEFFQVGDIVEIHTRYDQKWPSIKSWGSNRN